MSLIIRDGDDDGDGGGDGGGSVDVLGCLNLIKMRYRGIQRLRDGVESEKVMNDVVPRTVNNFYKRI